MCGEQDLRRWSSHKMCATNDPNAASDLPPFDGTSRGYTGTSQVRPGDEFTVNVQNEVVDLSSLVRARGDMQPRDRSRIGFLDCRHGRPAGPGATDDIAHG